MALAPRPFLCQFNPTLKPDAPRPDPSVSLPVPKVKLSDVTSSGESGKILLQPRVCTLRSYGSDRVGLIKPKGDGGVVVDNVSPFFATLSEYIESTKNSQDFEILSGRLAMMVFAGTITVELVTGNSVFRKMDLQGIAEGAGVCIGAVAFAALFAWFSSARGRVGRIFSIKCNSLIDSFIDQIVDGLFFDTDLNDWSDEL